MPTAEITRKSALLTNLADINTRIARACAAAGRDPSAVELLAVTKYAASPDVKLLLDAGAIKTAGENKVQDAASKWTKGNLAAARTVLSLHFIGHLQTNKARAAVEIFDWIDSIDSVKIAAEVNRHAGACGKVMPVLIQLKLTASASQSGVGLAQAGELLAAVQAMPNLAPRGYMGIAPAGATAQELKNVFAAAKTIFDRDFPLSAGKHGFKNYLSLGMSGDFELAVQAGANLPRIGSALFA
ncbi:MAG: YggS family pyridoxal phosphate enzyme [Elusimicrobia bacterium RIFOXYA12_FULL_57_11]|nr:MAG: YggS family pyridoxal phosphate enzyme [Elusimicrobia bacterium RIFOXYA12_FULL_57_11]